MLLKLWLVTVDFRINSVCWPLRNDPIIFRNHNMTVSTNQNTKYCAVRFSSRRDDTVCDTENIQLWRNRFVKVALLKCFLCYHWWVFFLLSILNTSNLSFFCFSSQLTGKILKTSWQAWREAVSKSHRFMYGQWESGKNDIAPMVML